MIHFGNIIVMSHLNSSCHLDPCSHTYHSFTGLPLLLLLLLLLPAADDAAVGPVFNSGLVRVPPWPVMIWFRLSVLNYIKHHQSSSFIRSCAPGWCCAQYRLIMEDDGWSWLKVTLYLCESRDWPEHSASQPLSLSAPWLAQSYSEPHPGSKLEYFADNFNKLKNASDDMWSI